VESFAAGTEPAVRGFLHRPVSGSGGGIVLAHGAGSNARAPLLVAVAESLAGRGIAVLRADLPYRQARPGGPPGPGDAARDRAGLKHAVEALRAAGRVPRAGIRGGRQAPALCAEEPGPVAGLLMSYPLHPPRKPSRDAHLQSPYRRRCCTERGIRFETIEELEVVRLIVVGRKLSLWKALDMI
jgi:predicted alpha/beta-hydrolase family hydrolase